MTRTRPASCAGCSLCNMGTDFLRPEGLGTLKVALLGESSGEHEQRDELPFRPWAPSGMLLERTLRRLGYSRDQFSIANSIFCKPPGNELAGASYEQDAIQHCEPNVLAFLAKFKPRVVVALGAIAFRTLTGISGTQRGISHSRGYIFPALEQFSIAAGREPDLDPLLVLPTYHPSFLRRGAIHLTGVFARDLQRAVNVAAGKDCSYILESPEFEREWIADESNPDYMDGPPKEWLAERESAWLARHGFRYLTHPTLTELDLFCRDVKQRSDAWLALSPAERDVSLIALSHDIETYESASLDEDESDGFTDTQVRLSQFSVEPGQGIAMPWRDQFIQATRWLLKLPLSKVGQNYWYFDARVLRAVGRRDFGDENYFRANGTVYDTLQQFHYFEPDLPAHLQYAASYVQFPLPWKHLSGENLELYGCFDTDSALRIFYMTRRTMQDRGIWTDPVAGRAAAGYLNMVQAVRPILAAMEDRGLPINDARRLALGVEFDKVRQELFVELDGRFPDSARKVTPKDGYKGVPAAVKLLLESLEPTASIVDGMLGANGKPLTKTAKAKLVKESLEARWANITDAEMATIRQTRYQDPSEKQDDGTEEPGDSYYFDVRKFGRQDLGGGILTDGSPAWCRIYQFSPNSSPQLMNYMRVKRHKVPVDKKRKSETTGKKELERLAAKHHDDFYTKTIECREMGKMSSTYVDGFKPAADGRVHPTFTFSTSTGQLSSRAPNSQNYPVHGKLGKAVKSMIEAPDGYEIGNWDYKSYHVLMLGFLAEDPGYMRLARLDIHSFVAWNFLKLPGATGLLDLPDEELLEKFAWLKSNEKYAFVRDQQAKRSILGIGNGLMPPTLYEKNREYFESLAQAKQFRSLIEGLFPRVFRWQNRVCDEAHQKQILMNRFGMLRRFYEVLQPDGRGGWRPGDQYNMAISYRLQSEAHGELRERFKMLEQEGAAAKFGFNNTIHDSVQFCYRKELRAAMLQQVGEILSRPSRILIHPTLAPNGLVVGVECSVGNNMAELTKIKLPSYIEPCKLVPALPATQPQQGSLLHA